ncbi:MAG: myxococcus cysteine-rich repeat containing protein [Myxococcota bacterium]
MASLARPPFRSYSRRSQWTSLVAGLALGGLLGGAAHAATWGSFIATRMAYATGPLTADSHDELQMIIADRGDLVGNPTGQLTADYLEGVDVFYTAMLSDGTGPTAGLPGTLSPAEQTALQDWIAAGGTLIVTADSNGMGGPFAEVYDSWTFDYDVTAYDWIFNSGNGMPSGIEHPITSGVGSYFMDNPTTFAHGVEGVPLGSGLSAEQPFLVVFEPATGFAAGGRMLVVADHNALTDLYIEELDNRVLAANIVAWAAGECGNTIVESDEECDDGNLEDGDGCDAACIVEAGAGSSGGTGDTTGAEATGTTGGSGGSSGESSTSGTTALVDGSGGEPGTASTAGGDGQSDGGGAADDGGEGCGCRSEPGPVGVSALLLGLVLGRRRGRP